MHPECFQCSDMIHAQARTTGKVVSFHIVVISYDVSYPETPFLLVIQALARISEEDLHP